MTLTAARHAELVAAAEAALAATAARLGADAIRRAYPRHIDGNLNRPQVGRWQIIVAGEERPATSAQARALTAAAGILGSGYASIGPIAAAL